MPTPNLILSGGAFEDLEGNPLANGYLIMELSHDANYSAGPYQITAGIKLKIQLDASGNINPTVQVWSNDILTPAGSYYTVTAYKSDGTQAYRNSQFWVLAASPSPLNVATIVPTNPPGFLAPGSNAPGYVAGTNISIIGNVISAVGLVSTTATGSQTILSNLLPGAGNTTQSLGNAGAPWDANLYDLVVQDSFTFGKPGAVSEIVMTGSTDPWSGLIQNAINALPAGGGTIDGTAAGVAALPQGFITLSGKKVTILLGPYTYTLNNIVVTTGTKLLGSSLSTTVIQAADTVTTPITMDPLTTVIGIELANFNLSAQSGSAYTQNGIAFILNGTTNTGLWYSSLHDLYISGFGGINLDFDGSGGGDGATGGLGLNQFNNIKHVIAFRKNVAAWVYGTSYVPGNTVTINNGTVTTYDGATTYAPGDLVILSGAPTVIYMAFFPTAGEAPPNGLIWQPLNAYEIALTYVNIQATSTQFPTFGSYWVPYESYCLKVSGYAGQLFFDTCEFDSQFGGPNSGTNIGIYATSLSNFAIPNGITLYACTCQFASLGAYINGGLSIHFTHCHHEALWGGYLVDGAAGIGTGNFIVDNGYWATGACANGGAGYAVQFTTSAGSGCDLLFVGNGFYNACDTVVIGGSELSIIVKDNSTLATGLQTLGPYSGVVPVITASINPNVGRTHCVYLTGATSIKDIQTTFGPGEMITFIASTSGVNFETGGSPTSQFFLGTHSTYTLEVNGGAIFMKSDAPNMNGWVLVGATP